jgi:hypothetical protein
MPIPLIVRPGVDSAVLARRAPYINDCRGFALTRRGDAGAGQHLKPGDGQEGRWLRHRTGVELGRLRQWSEGRGGVTEAGVFEKIELSTSGVGLAVAGGYILRSLDAYARPVKTYLMGLRGRVFCSPLTDVPLRACRQLRDVRRGAIRSEFHEARSRRPSIVQQCRSETNGVGRSERGVRLAFC